MNIFNFIKRHSVLTYFIITFIISWGGFILAIGPSGFTNTNVWQESSFGYVVLSMLTGPSIAGLLMISLIDGKSGFRKFFSRLFRWRVGMKWYAMALLPAPALSLLTLWLLSISSPFFVSSDKFTIILSGILAGLATVFEEIGWTGFATPKLRQRNSVFVTGLIVGVIWGLWHLLQQIYISGTYTGGVPLEVYMFWTIFNTIAGLTAYRILLVWVYDRTDSLLITTLMHASLTACNVFIFRPEATGLSFLVFGLVFAIIQWIFVAVIALTNRKQFFAIS